MLEKRIKYVRDEQQGHPALDTCLTEKKMHFRKGGTRSATNTLEDAVMLLYCRDSFFILRLFLRLI